MELKNIFKRKLSNDSYTEIRSFCRKTLGFSPRNIELFHTALTHKSSMQEFSDGRKLNNERLEYLGDAMLSAIVAEHLYSKYPNRGEGYLTELRSKIVSRRSLNKIAHKMGLFDIISYNRSAIRISQNRSLEGNALEALIGAIYIDRGYSFTRKVVLQRIINHYTDIETLANTDWNYKGRLIDYCQKRHLKLHFVLDRTERHGHDNHAVYYVHVEIDGQTMDSANGLSIKSAEQLASERTYRRLVPSEALNKR
ncbi:MAG: ribonuclease III [Bacteroidales bacterium]|nr:ribonuclease III [Bacteroidales bacterium]